MSTEKKRASALTIMGRLIGLVKPLLPIIILAIILGIIGYLCAIFLSITAVYAGICLMYGAAVKKLFILLIVMAVARGFLHYGEQYCNHLIAFKLLALIRHKVFAKLRKLCPAKLEGKDRGNLISLITSDIELLEVFYAHTISPIAIAAVVSAIMTVFIGRLYAPAAIIAACGYAVVGILIPVWNGRKGSGVGMSYRNAIGDMSSCMMESLRGLDETIQYRQGRERLGVIRGQSEALASMRKGLNRREAAQRSSTNLMILVFSFIMLFFMIYSYMSGQVGFHRMILAIVAMMGSFGPVTALSNLSNNLNQTLASGQRVLDLLDEEPEVEEIDGQAETTFSGASAEHVDFSYGEKEILRDFSMDIPQGQVTGIIGPSGCGKSTFLKLLMRFWRADAGHVRVSGRDVEEINTKDLRDMQSYVTQETYLFHDSIANNIEIGRPGATRKEIIEAAKKASIHDFIMSLPQGYDTPVGELGDTLSGGEKQRIGIARAFLHNAPLLILDEPTSNLDALNEGVILKSLQESKKDRTIVLVSHRKSTMRIADRIYSMEIEETAE